MLVDRSRVYSACYSCSMRFPARIEAKAEVMMGRAFDLLERNAFTAVESSAGFLVLVLLLLSIRLIIVGGGESGKERGIRGRKRSEDVKSGGNLVVRQTINELVKLFLGRHVPDASSLV